MADYLNNVAAGDAYSPALTLGPDYNANYAVITVANNAVLMQFAVGVPGDWRWTDEREFYSIPQSFRVGRIIGVRFRNANPGSVARVLAVLANDSDPDFQSGMPFAGVLTASGSVVSSAGVTGLVNSDGTVLGGTGFTVTKNGTGDYSISFDTAFSATPAVLLSIVGSTDANIVLVTPVSYAFRVFTYGAGGAQADSAFHFLAQPIS